MSMNINAFRLPSADILCFVYRIAHKTTPFASQKHEKINVSENHNQPDNLIAVGLPSADYTEAASVGIYRTENLETESSESTEQWRI